MKSRVTCVRVTDPDGNVSTHELTTGRASIGRATPDGAPDLALGPDPHRLISRVHCVIEYSAGSWSVTDNASGNGTVLRRAGEMTRLCGTSSLRHGDSVCILGDITPEGLPRYWKLKFDDPFRTEPAPCGLTPEESAADTRLAYDWIQMKVFRVEGANRAEITRLPPQAHKLIRYMAELSHRNNGSPVACSHTELIHVLWGEPAEWPRGRAYDETNLRNVVNTIRKRIEPDPSNPRLLQTERNIGYRLAVHTEQTRAGV